MQTEIYRDKVLRARAMTPAERLAEALELSNDSSFRQQHERGVGFRLDDDALALKERGHSCPRLDLLRERGSNDTNVVTP